MMTMHELARLCGVSKATVSLVLNDKDQGRVGPALRAKILKAARHYGYRSNPIARGLSENRTYRIGIVLWGMLSEHAIIGEFSLYDRLGLAAEKINGSGYALELLQINRSKPLKTIAAELIATRVDGFLFLDWNPPERLAFLLAALKKKNLPATAISTTLPVRGHTWVNVDRSEFIQDAIRRFVELGHRQIAFVEAEINDSHLPKKRAAFVKALSAELGLAGADWLYRPLTDAGIPEVIERLRRERPDCRGFLLNDNFQADAVLTALRRTGLTPGQDCRVFGFGDTVIAERCSPSLSHYSLQSKRQVEFAVGALLRWIEHPKEFNPISCLLPPEFIERET